MKLSDLAPQFLKNTGKGHSHIVEISIADGIIFLCPICFAQIKKKGCHSVICWFVGKVSDEEFPKPGRWTMSGISVKDLTLAPSVHLIGASCNAHFHIHQGQIIVC